MDLQAQQILVTLIRHQRIAALGTLRNDAPEVTMVPIAASPDCTAFYLHLSKLAHHTQNISHDARVSLMVAEADDGMRNPQTLARVSIQGDAILIAETANDYAPARFSYLARFPQAEMTFTLNDFGLYKIEPKAARLVAGFAQTYNLTVRDFREAGSASTQ